MKVDQVFTTNCDLYLTTGTTKRWTDKATIDNGNVSNTYGCYKAGAQFRVRISDPDGYTEIEPEYNEENDARWIASNEKADSLNVWSRSITRDLLAKVVMPRHEG